MRRIQEMFVAAAASLILGMLGCDQSKAELEQTKTQLQAVTAERDALKSQVSGLQGQVATLQQQLGDANAKLAAATVPPGADASRSPAHHRRPSAPATSGSQAVDTTQPPPPTPAQLEQKAAEKQMTGKASMNN